MNELRFCWWNVCDYAEYVAGTGMKPERGPTSDAEYDEKTRRLIAAFDAMYGADSPELIGLCELTPATGRRLQATRFPDHDLLLSDPTAATEYQVAALVKRNVGLSASPALVASGVPRSTREMPVVDCGARSHSIRFVFCHWTAFDKEMSQEYRGRLADALRVGVYDYLRPRSRGATRHVVVLGDLNIEPFDPILETKLSARRYRDHARQQARWIDADVHRVRLYNCAWRFLGEQRPHTTPVPTASPAGTYFHSVSGRPMGSGWHGFDQVLVSGGLLSDQRPFLDEARLCVRAEVGNLVDGRPAKFTYANGVGSGVSDHLPVTGVVALA